MALTDRGTVSYEVERTLRTIFKRCVQCPPLTPTCPACDDGEICSLIPQDCNNCAHMTCISNPAPAPTSEGPNVGAIAGGVVAGIFAIGVAVFLVWFLWIRKRRQQQERETESWESDIAQHRKARQFSTMQTDAASTRTRGSLANSILSRASNIIQIAYIPGITNRNGNGRDSLLHNTPVPPIPAAFRQGTGSSTPKTPLSNDREALFFRPGDLRGSTYSATTVGSRNRDTQYSRQSITPSLARSSMASEIYTDNATAEPMPTVVRALPRMVSVKSSQASVGSNGRSPTPSGDESPGSAQAPQVMMPGSTVNGASNNIRGKATQVTVTKGKGRFPIRRQDSDGSTTGSSGHVPPISSTIAEVDESINEDEEEYSKSRKSVVMAGPGPTFSKTDEAIESPFSDASERPADVESGAKPNPYETMASSVGVSEEDGRNARTLGGLSAVIEEATQRASALPAHDGLGGRRDVSPSSRITSGAPSLKVQSSPFSDEHRTE